jgi:hypothetical protein
MIAWACAVALGKPHGRFEPVAPGVVITYNVEDDTHEQRRRLSAALGQFDAMPADVGDLIGGQPQADERLYMIHPYNNSNRGSHHLRARLGTLTSCAVDANFHLDAMREP